MKLGDFLNSINYTKDDVFQEDKKMQYDYLRLAIRKRKRFSKWLKEEYPEDLECIKQYFGYSNEKAKQVLDLLDAEMIAEMKEELDEGGVR